MQNPRIPWYTQPFALCFLVFLVASTIAQETEDEIEFNYIGGSERGPEHWGELKREWAMCNKGRMQSPINLFHPRVQAVPKSEEIFKFYKPSNATLKNRGHDIEVKWEGENSKIQIHGTCYILQQAHWHSPSEHTINGHRFAMELHMVHQSRGGRIAVIGLLYDIGHPDPFLEKLKKKIKSISETLKEIEAGVINPEEIDLKGNKYYRYMGSLTTPPCTEGVLWTVNKEIATVSKKQVALLRKVVHDGAKENARPLQPLNGRKVKLYAHDFSRGVDENSH